MKHEIYFPSILCTKDFHICTRMLCSGKKKWRINSNPIRFASVFENMHEICNFWITQISVNCTRSATKYRFRLRINSSNCTLNIPPYHLFHFITSMTHKINYRIWNRELKFCCPKSRLTLQWNRVFVFVFWKTYLPT